VRVGVRRFWDSFEPVDRLAASASATLRIRADRGTRLWHLRVALVERSRMLSLG
jgi:hypothetical protein